MLTANNNLPHSVSDRFIEKGFLYLLCVSLILHLMVFAGLYYLPMSPPPEPSKEPIFIDLQEIPKPRQPLVQHKQETRRSSEQRIQPPKENTLRGSLQHDAEVIKKQAAPSTEMSPSPIAKPSTISPQAVPQITPGFSVGSLLKSKEQDVRQEPSIPQLFPGAGHLAKLEENYRRKYEKDINEGDTRFLNSDDILFGSFLHRLEGAIYGVWRYPQEAAMNGVEGVTPVRITFNRQGEISNVERLESSGSRILDDEVLRTLKAIGRGGGFPKGYDKDEFHLIAFFQYAGSRRSLR